MFEISDHSLLLLCAVVSMTTRLYIETSKVTTCW